MNMKNCLFFAVLYCFNVFSVAVEKEPCKSESHEAEVAKIAKARTEILFLPPNSVPANLKIEDFDTSLVTCSEHLNKAFAVLADPTKAWNQFLGQLLHVLVKRAPQISFRYADGNTLLHYAVSNRDFELVEILRDKPDYSFDTENNDKASGLTSAVITKHTDMVAALLKGNRACPNVFTSFSPLAHAMAPANYSPWIVKLLLLANANPLQEMDVPGTQPTPLLCAAIQNIDGFKQIIENGISLLDGTDFNPLISLALVGSTEVWEIILANQANINNFSQALGQCQDPRFNPPLHYLATRSGFSVILGKLLNYVDDPNQLDHHAGLAPLHMAAHHSQLENVKSLLANGANANTVSAGLRLPLHYASDPNIKKILQEKMVLSSFFFGYEYFISLPAQLLGLPQENKNIVAKVNFDRANKTVSFVFDASEKLKAQTRTLAFENILDQHGTLRFVKGKKTLFLDAKTAWVKAKNGKASIRNGAVMFLDDWVFSYDGESFMVSFKSSIQGNNKVQNKAFKLELFVNKPPVEETSAPRSLVKEKKSLVQPLPSKAEKTVVYPVMEQIAGTYKGGINGDDNFTVIVPEFGLEHFALEFFIPHKKTGQVEKKSLIVRALTKGIVGNDFSTFEPLSLPALKFFKDKTTFEGGRVQSQAGKKAKGTGELRFSSLMGISPLSADGGPVVLEVSTHQGTLKLSKVSNQTSIPAVEEPFEVNALEEPDNFAEMFAVDEELGDDVELYDFQPAEEAPVLNEPAVRRTKKRNTVVTEDPLGLTKEEIRKYGQLGPSRQEQERAEKHLRDILPKLIATGERLDKQEKSQAAAKHLEVESHLQPVLVAPKISRPHKLSSHKTFEENPLFSDGNVWFAHGFKSNARGSLKRDTMSDFALSLLNFNGMEQFAPQASWCSLFTSLMGKDNFQNGMNVHCSYHFTHNEHYLNISHFGLFLIMRREHNNGYILHQVPTDPSAIEGRLVFILKPFVEGAIKSGNKKLNALEASRLFVGCKEDAIKYIEQCARNTRLMELRDQVIERLLHNPLPIRYRHRALTAIFNRNKHRQLGGEIVENSQLWSRMECFSVQMINEHTAFLSILFVNHMGQLEAITESFNVDSDVDF